MTSVSRRQEHDDSGDYSDASQDIEHHSVNEAHPESDYDSQGSETENSEQDPENKETERRVDDDEDRSNPQYIPKRGTFYEHDDRTAASGEEANNTTSETASEKKEGSEAGGERRRPPRKSDVVNKWSHDKFNENEQMPKSREELVAIYGYDIRNEDAPPHARRNRRYGRGPNKYTRTWEDEEAYRRQSAAQAQPRKPPNPEDFPELEAAGKIRGRKPRAPRPRSKSQPNSNDSIDSSPPLRRNASIKTTKKPIMRPAAPKPVPAKPKETKLPAIENLTITANLSNNQGQAPRKVNAAVAQQRPVPTDQAKKKPTPAQPQQQATPPPNKSPPQQQQKQQQQQAQQPPAAGGGSKRYSSLRQRPLADTYSPQPQQQPPQGQQRPPQAQAQQLPQGQQPLRPYTGQGEFVAHQPNQAAHPQHLIHQQVRVPPATGANNAHPLGGSPPQPQQLAQQPPHAQQVRLGMMEPPLVPHAHHAVHNLPQPHAIGQIPPSQGYAPPAMMPAQYMQPQSSSGAVFGGPLYGQPPHGTYPHQVYPHHNYATQAGGVTYYNCPEPDLPQPQPRTQRRPTAAIPIVRPQPNDRPANSSEKDNIDRIVENMFVRKPWPAHGAEGKDKNPENRSSQEPQSKESSQPNSLTSSSISTDSKPSEPQEKTEEEKPQKETVEEISTPADQSITTDA